MTRWLLYGANGYTGELIADEAVKRGHDPVLAGRTESKIALIAHRLNLDYMIFHLDDVNTIAEAVADLDLVVHAAGPFIETSAPMVKACLATRTHYLDITGEIPVFEAIFTQDEVARKNGVALIPGVGFDVVPTDCLAKYVSDQLPTATELYVAFDSLNSLSGGTTQTAIEFLKDGGKVRQNGELKYHPFGHDSRQLQFMHGNQWVTPIPWGDLSTGFRSTGIPNIMTYMALARPMIWGGRLFGAIGQALLGIDPLRRGLRRFVDWRIDGPNLQKRQTGRSYIYAEAWDEEGTHIGAWLDTVEAYRFTAEATVLAVEQTLELQPVGALTPSLAFGADFVLQIQGTRRLDRLTVGDWQKWLR